MDFEALLQDLAPNTALQVLQGQRTLGETKPLDFYLRSSSLTGSAA